MIKMTTLTIWLLLIIAVVIVIVLNRGQLFSVIDSSMTEWKELSCQTDSDCVEEFLAMGVTQQEINEQLEIVELYCGSQNYCIARSK